MKIEEIQIKNYRAFKNAILRDIPDMCIITGANGTGKSTLFDIFTFLRDSLTHNVSQALSKRGGFKEVLSRGQDGRIEIKIKFRESAKSPLVTYELQIGQEEGRAIVEREILKFRRGTKGQPWHFLDFSRGIGSAITNEDEYNATNTHASMQREEQSLDAPDILAIKGLGQFKKFKAVSEFRRLVEQWHISDFHIQEARPSQEIGYAEHLSTHGENLSQVAQYLHENHPEEFQAILDAMSHRVPGVSNVQAQTTVDGRIVLQFQDGSFKDPFIARYVSDGTIKMFAYLVLLHDPKPFSLLAVEEPENQLYPKLLWELAEEFRSYTQRGGQVFISTHSPDFLNAATIDEVYWLVKENGYTVIKRAKDDPQLVAFMDEGDQMGYLWKQGFFEGIDPQ